ncbi:DegT/DnrJ/EryC1/StrS family aminotransferase [Pseudoxanthomonas sp. CF125]|uniref:DegT/DnrJ/EryC1/StrS family aminotransferase n=1 Tax=Pseudoxanthomonas sp. CF125 TaxID=1855303 RepID=UPI0008912810|nr:DegT/DnrJ/EryC1/StrS family aminotransferase [Pseudoxanthomonas sp. CF125]SDQ88930.1 dTDP-4-amino-4,6-dideoxygalactose transaminase [Pseudoxanthomonas sp. CF125]
MPIEVVPVNSLRRHIEAIEGQLTDAANEVIRSGYFVLGPNVKAFEAEFAGYCGVEHCVSMANGTDALELSLRALGIREHDRVAVVANAAMYSTTAVTACGGEPVFIDVLADEATMDPAALAAALAAQPLKAVVVTHLYGRLAHIQDLVEQCRRAGVPVVEDCAQAHGAASVDGRKAGAFGDIGTFSFYPTKNLGALGDGGAVVCRDTALADRLRQLRQYGWSQKYTNALAGGRNSRLDEIQAGMLRCMLPLLDGWNERRRAVANRYSANIHNGRIALSAPAGQEYVGHLYVARTSERAALQSHLQQAGIQSEIHYPIPDHRQPCFGERFLATTLPVTETLCETVITLPCFPEITDEEVQRVIDACNQF